MPIITGAQTGWNSDDTFSRQFDYWPVGTFLHVRPHMTQEGQIDLIINRKLSPTVTATTVSGNFIFDHRETTTHVIAKDGRKVMISDIISKENFDTKHEFPVLGDIPLFESLIPSSEKALSKRKVMTFIRPRVIDTEEDEDDDFSNDNSQWLDRFCSAMENEQDQPAGDSDQDGQDQPPKSKESDN